MFGCFSETSPRSQHHRIHHGMAFRGEATLSEVRGRISQRSAVYRKISSGKQRRTIYRLQTAGCWRVKPTRKMIMQTHCETSETHEENDHTDTLRDEWNPRGKWSCRHTARRVKPTRKMIIQTHCETSETHEENDHTDTLRDEWNPSNDKYRDEWCQQGKMKSTRQVKRRLEPPRKT